MHDDEPSLPPLGCDSLIEHVRTIFPTCEVRVGQVWTRRNSRLYLLEVEQHGRFIAKQTSQNDFDDIEQAKALEALYDDALAGLDPPMRTVEIAGVLTDPNLVITRQVEGMELSGVLAEACGDGTATERDTALESAHRSGLALGRLHLRLPVPDGSTDVLARVRRRFRLPERWEAMNRQVVRLVCSVEDFAPNNICRSHDGELYLLDRSSRAIPVTAHDDCASFMVGLHSSTYTGRLRRTRPARSIARLANAAFIEGYGEAGVIDPTARRDRALIQAILAYRLDNMVLKLVRRRGREDRRRALSLTPLAFSYGARTAIQGRWPSATGQRCSRH